MTDVRILDAPAHREQLWPLSVEAYHALGEMGLIPEKTELLRGFVFYKMPKSPQHSALVTRLLAWLQAAIAQQRLLVRMEQPITCGDSEPEPDLAVVTGVNEDYFDCHPTTAELVVELAITSKEFDRAKGGIYSAAGVREYWLVDVSSRRIEINRQPSATGYLDVTYVADGEIAQSSAVPTFALNVSELLQR